MNASASRLKPLAKDYTIVLETFRKSGVAVPTPVNIVVEGDTGYFRTYRESGKAKRMRRNQHVRVAKSNITGKPKGEFFDCVVRQVSGVEEARVRQMIEAKHPILQRRIVPLTHKLRKHHTVHYALQEAAGQE